MSDLFENTAKCRDTFYASLGQLEPDVIAHLINPSFMGGPTWPALRQAYNIIRCSDSVIIASNGLSDPFDDWDEINSGFEIEIFAETKQPLGSDVAASWLFKLVYAVSQQAAHNGQFKSFIEAHEVITMEVCSEAGLERLENTNGNIGIILGVEHPNRKKYVDFPGASVAIVTVQLLTPDELDYVVEHRANGRRKIHQLLKEKGHYHFCNPDRESVLL